MKVEKKCIFFPTRSHPKTRTARNPDSRKKAKIPSAARGGAEDVAHKAGVDGPIGAELELHDDSGGDTDGESDGEQFDPELGEAVPVGIACFQPDGLEDDEEHSHPDREGREEVVHHNGEGELEA